MKSFRILIGTALFLLPWAAWAQTNPPEPPSPDASPMTAGVVVAGQNLPDGPPPPPGAVIIQKRVIAGGGPGNAPFMPQMEPEPGMGLGAWWKNSEIVSKLQLSEDVVKKVERTFLDHKLKLIDLQADLEKQELRLQPLLDVDHPDEGKVGTQIDLITGARGRLEKESAMMMLAIRGELTVEQWKKLKSMEAANRGKTNFFYWRGNGDMPAGPVIYRQAPFPPQPPGATPKPGGPQP